MMQQIQFRDGTKYTPSKIFGIGLNYAKHINEMNSKRPAEPVIFTKPNTAIHDMTRPIPIPKGFGAVHHEVELALCISKTCSDVPEAQAMDYLAGYGVALDLTLRDIQSVAKKNGHPWAIAKGFDKSCPLSEFVPVTQVEDVNNLNLELIVNDTVRQQSNTSHMLFKIPELISYISKFFTLMAGDIIITGTPSGVGPLLPGDKIKASIDNIASVETSCL